MAEGTQTRRDFLKLTISALMIGPVVVHVGGRDTSDPAAASETVTARHGIAFTMPVDVVGCNQVDVWVESATSVREVSVFAQYSEEDGEGWASLQSDEVVDSKAVDASYLVTRRVQGAGTTQAVFPARGCRMRFGIFGDVPGAFQVRCLRRSR